MALGSLAGGVQGLSREEAAVVPAASEFGLTDRAKRPPDVTEGYDIGTYTRITVLVLGGLALIVLGNAYLSSPDDHLLGYVRYLSRGRKEDNLFLGFPFERQGGERTDAYLRSLSVRRAVFLTKSPIKKGELVRLHVGSLPEYPEENAWLEGRVHKVKTYERTNTWHKVEVALDRSITLPGLEPYLDQLRGHHVNRTAS